MKYCHIYYYRYQPKWIGFLPEYDALPLVIPLKVSGKMMLGLNLHWIPPGMRTKLVVFILNIYDKTDPKTAFHITYQSLKKNPKLEFTLKAIRKYYLKRCTSVLEIPQIHWGYLSKMSKKEYKAKYIKLLAPSGLLKKP